MSLRARAAALDLCAVQDAPAEAALTLRDIRNEDGVRRHMYSDRPIEPTEHKHWLAGLKADPTRALYLVRNDGALVGALAFSAIDPAHRRADWAFYLGAASRGRGLGRALELRALDLAFGPMELAKLNCEVIAWNTAVIALHRAFGFVEEGRRRNHVLRDGAFHDAVLLGITDTEWQAARQDITKDETP